ncbi:cell surface hyaluronidase CEMIP2-like isoform X3 [Chiloscyllium punctatum]|uniref:cell surface hyaluronidase CEMIP2-like isoform X3 n=1 Tax=Chiloscyllium punctatum TaxID=137246 RepID=UPI003B63991E
MKTDKNIKAQSAVKDISTSCSSERFPQCRITQAVNLWPSLQKHLFFQSKPPVWQAPLLTLASEDRLCGKRTFGPGTPKAFTYHLLLFVVFLLVLPGLLHCDGKSQLSQGKGSKGLHQSIQTSPLNMAPDGVANPSDTYPLYKRSAQSTRLRKGPESSLLTIYQSMKKTKETRLTCNALVEVTNHILRKAAGKNLSRDFFQLPTCDQKMIYQLTKINPLNLIKVKIKPQLLYEVLLWLKQLNLLLDVHQAKSFSIVKKLMLNKEQRVFGTTGVPHCGFRVEVSKGVILNLMDDATSWLPGNQIVIASTDYSMYQAEHFKLLPCPKCKVNQVKIDGKPRYLHMGEVIDGIDMRAEVGLLSRNILIKGEMEDSCYGQNFCHFFSHDTFGGQIKILQNFASVHLSGVELTNMGQQILGSYPVHFHLAGDVDKKGGYNPPTYVDNVAIHHCFSRCVAIHGTNGLLVKHTIGYDTLGHCFFLEDGVEQRNILYHNLGLLTKPGTILPSDRNEIMCVTIRDHIYGNYIPVPSADCMAVTTFWISNPNNHLINNAAAGAQDVGIWFIFHRAPTGQSVGQYPEGQSEFTPLGVFYNNRVHSNFKAGLFIGSGVKTTESNAEDPREVLTVDFARFRPHQNADPRKPRVPAIIDGLVSFKNNDHGAWARGGDIIFRNSGFSDNGIGLTLASDGTFPTDEGSSLEVTKSIFVGESINVGCNGGQNRYWGKGAHGEYRTLPRNRTFPIRGFQIYDGPVRITKCTFKNYISVHERYSSALAFFMRNSWQISPQNNVSQVKLEWNVNLEVFFGKPGQWFGTNTLDGDQTSIFHDLDGSMTGYPDTFVARADNYLVRHPGCLSVPRWNGVICSGKYAQLYVQAWRPENLSLLITKDSYPAHPLKLQGVNRGASYQQYQPVVMLEQAYTLRWNGRTPEQIVLYPINFNRGNWIQVGLCYPKRTVFKVMSDIYDRSSGRVHSVKRYKAVSSFNILQKHPDKSVYYFDSSAGILFLILQAKHVRKGHSYCSKHGCERVKILSHVISWESSDCLRKGHSVKHSSEAAHLITLTGRVAAPCRHCGAPQVAITSDPHRVYIKIEIQSQSTGDIQNGHKFSFIKVNDEVFLSEKAGLLFVLVDACSGDTLSRQYFDTAHTLQVADSITNYIQATIRERSIALICSRGDSGWALNYVSSAFLRLGAAKPINFFKEGSFAMLGFKSQLKPAWIKIRSHSAGQLAASLQHYVPLKLSEYSCSGKTKENRKDLKLFQDLILSN